MRKVRLASPYSLGDVIVLTGVVRDLQRSYPGLFEVSVQTPFPALWRYNPHVSPQRPGAEEIDCSSIPIDRFGTTGRHYYEACLEMVNERIGVVARPGMIGGDIHLSEQEKNWYSDIYNFCGEEIPFWLICPGGKFDIPIKWWDHQRYQAVVSALKGKVQFVQVGAWGNYHPTLEGVIDLRGRTRVRDLIHLVYNAEGVLCGVTSLMHMAAAVPVQEGRSRSAIIIAGAREPRSWEAYPGHDFIGTHDRVSCGNCWKGAPAGLMGREPREGDCEQLRHALPACMDEISVDDVLERFETLEQLGRVRPLRKRGKTLARKAVESSVRHNNYGEHNLHPLNAVERAEAFIRSIPRFPKGRFKGRGIVICGGGVQYFTCSWIAIRMLRQLGCALPVELWHLGSGELDAHMEQLAAPLNVRCVNARKLMRRHPMRNPLGWELKCYSILNSRFEEVLFLDADNVPVRNPEYLFDCPEYRSAGAIFWPDYSRLDEAREIWKLTGVSYRDEPEFESGQIFIHKEKCWRELNLAWWYNDHSEFFYRYIHGDKDTFHLAWRKLGTDWAMPPFPIHPLPGTMCQHDFLGQRLFQHRNLKKFQFFGANESITDFRYEADCLQFLNELRSLWDGKIKGQRERYAKRDFYFRAQTADEGIFNSVIDANEYRLPDDMSEAGTILDIGAHIGSFTQACLNRGARRVLAYEPHRDNFELAHVNLKARSQVRLRMAAVLDRHGQASVSDFHFREPLQNTGGVEVSLAADGSVPAFSLDEIARKEKQIGLVKLDCEGSEWPIVLHSKEWPRITAVCGEYHEREFHPLCPEAGSALTRGILGECLRRHYRHVRIVPDNDGAGLGKFWASQTENYFVTDGQQLNDE